MRLRDTPSVIRDDPGGHPAVRAWLTVRSDSALPESIHVLKRPAPGSKSGVFRMEGVGPKGVDIVAKESLLQSAPIERSVYEWILPRLSVDGPRYLGSAPSEDPSRAWLFMEMVKGVRFDRAASDHRTLAARWLSLLHSESAMEFSGTDLPTRSADWYKDQLEAAICELAEVLANPCLSSADVDLLEAVQSHLESVGDDWERIADLYSSLPCAIVHGDFKPNNLALVRGTEGFELRAFDWAEAHWGPAAIDIGALALAGEEGRISDADIDTYGEGLRQTDKSPKAEWLGRSKRLGLLLRTILAVRWGSPSLRTAWVGRTLRKMESYERLLRAVTVGRRRKGF